MKKTLIAVIFGNIIFSSFQTMTDTVSTPDLQLTVSNAKQFDFSYDDHLIRIASENEVVLYNRNTQEKTTYPNWKYPVLLSPEQPHLLMREDSPSESIVMVDVVTKDDVARYGDASSIHFLPGFQTLAFIDGNVSSGIWN